MITLRRAAQWYEWSRKKYFSDGHARPVPPASDLTWAWLPEGSPNLAVTEFDPDGDPVMLSLHPLLTRSGRLLRHTLLHEQTHMRLGAKVGGCSYPQSKRWQREALRLLELGADLL